MQLTETQSCNNIRTWFDMKGNVILDRPRLCCFSRVFFTVFCRKKRKGKEKYISMNDHFKYNLLVTFVTTFHATSQEDHQGTDPLTSGWHYRGRTYKYNEVHVNEISQMTPPPAFLWSLYRNSAPYPNFRTTLQSNWGAKKQKRRNESNKKPTSRFSSMLR